MENHKSTHPIVKYVSDSKGMGRDTILEKLKEEGFERFNSISTNEQSPEGIGTVSKIVISMLETVVALCRDKTIEHIRIIPAYLVNLSRYKETEHPDLVGNHSAYGNLHVVYVKRKQKS